MLWNCQRLNSNIVSVIPHSSILKLLKRKEVITYAQNERQQKPSQNQYHQRLRIPDCREAGDYCVSEY